MAEHKNNDLAPLDPALRRPHNEEVVDAAKVQFRWAAVEGASLYRLQVARDSNFDEVLLDEETTTETRFSAAGRFADDDETLYWRVLSFVDGQWSPGERIESFVAATPEEADLRLSRPDDDERYGPFPELIRSGAVSAEAAATGKEEFFEEEEEMGVEHEGVETAQIIGIAAAVIVALISMIIAVFFLYDNLQRNTFRAIVGTSGYPDLQRTIESGQRQLNEYGIIDEEAGIYRIPLDRAMDLMVQESLQRPPESFSSELPLLPESTTDRAAASMVSDTTATAPRAAAPAR